MLKSVFAPFFVGFGVVLNSKPPNRLKTAIVVVLAIGQFDPKMKPNGRIVRCHQLIQFKILILQFYLTKLKPS